jgi:two-component system, NtrC family, sensor kinase
LRISISARILAWFLLLLGVFGAVGATTVWRMHRSADQMALLRGGYLRVTLKLGEIEGLQGNLVGRLEDATRGDPVRRGALSGIRRLRAKELADVRLLVREAFPLARGEDADFLRTSGLVLHRLEQEMRLDDGLWDKLVGPASPWPPTAEVWKDLRMREDRWRRELRSALSQQRERVRGAANALERGESRAVWATLLLVVATLLAGSAAVLGARKTLLPLRDLAASAKAIAQGQYSQRVDVRAPDEIGALASEFNLMAEAIEERERRLIQSERLAAAGRVAAQVAHEVRNPLSAISLNAEMLQDELPAEAAEARRLVGGIRGEVERLEAITEEYLQFARLPAARPEREDLGALLSSLLDFMGEELGAASIDVRREIQVVPPVSGDDGQLRQAFLNLLRNAREAMPGGGRLTVRAAARDGRVQVAIEDTGSGIAAEDLPRIFDPFFSTKAGGTGLGLPITHRIVTEHHGRIDVEGGPGGGTRFVVTLPAIA